MSAGSYGLHLENSGRYGENKEWGVRFNGVGRNGEASINDGNWRTGLGALALDYRGERFRWTLDAISQNDDTKNFRPQMGIQTNVPFIPVVPDARSNWYPGTMLKQRDNTIATAAEYDISEALTAYAGIGYREGENYQTFPDSRVTGFPGGIDQFGNFRLINAYYDSYSKTTSGNAGIRSRFEVGPVGHAVNFAVHRLLPGERQRVCRQYAGPVRAVEYLQPVAASRRHRRAPAAAESQRDHAQKLRDRRHDVVPERDRSSSPSVLVTRGWSRMLSAPPPVLADSSYGAEAVTPLAGLVVKPLQNVSLYANYAEGLSQGIIVPAQLRQPGEILAPFKSKQQEAGIKVDWGTITTTAAVFQIARPLLITTAGQHPGL